MGSGRAGRLGARDRVVGESPERSGGERPRGWGRGRQTGRVGAIARGLSRAIPLDRAQAASSASLPADSGDSTWRASDSGLGDKQPYARLGG